MSAAASVVRFPLIVWRHPLLADLDARSRAELESAGAMRSYEEGTRIFSSGDPADELVVITKGEVVLRASARRAELRRATKGDAIGEEAAARAHATRRHDADAASRVEVALLPSPLLRRVMERSGVGDSRTQRWLARALATEALERADFSRDVPRKARDVMLDAGRAITLRRGDVLHREGDASPEAYFVAEGIVRLTNQSDKRVLAYHRAGDFFGDEAIEGEVRDATATAASDAWIYAVRKDVLREIAAEFPDAFARALRVQTSGRQKQREIRENATRHVLADLHRFETSRSLLAIDQSRCVRCGHCAWSCADAHDDGVSRLLRRGDVVVARMRGESRTLLLPSSCQHCKNPACMIDCPTGAITRDSRGEVQIREELCTGCGSCVKACPWDNIQLAEIAPKKNLRRLPLVHRESGAVAVKCDLCHDRGEPACIAACPADAIVRVDPSVDFDEVAAVMVGLDSSPRSERRTKTNSPVLVARAVIASSVFVGAAAFMMLADASRRTSGIALFVLFALLASYAIVKRFGARARGALRRAAVVRPHFVAHVALGMVSLGVALAHARGHSPLAIGFWLATALGALTAALFALVPKRLARIERSAILPEEIAPKIAALDARAFRELSGTSDLLKGLYAKILRAHSRSTAVLVQMCLLGQTQRAMRDALTARIHAIVGDDERLAGLEGLVSLTVERQALRAQRILTASLRATAFAHVVVACGLAVLVAVHVVSELVR